MVDDQNIEFAVGSDTTAVERHGELTAAAEMTFGDLTLTGQECDPVLSVHTL